MQCYEIFVQPDTILRIPVSGLPRTRGGSARVRSKCRRHVGTQDRELVPISNRKPPPKLPESRLGTPWARVFVILCARKSGLVRPKSFPLRKCPRSSKKCGRNFGAWCRMPSKPFVIRCRYGRMRESRTRFWRISALRPARSRLRRRISASGTCRVLYHRVGKHCWCCLRSATRHATPNRIRPCFVCLIATDRDAFRATVPASTKSAGWSWRQNYDNHEWPSRTFRSRDGDEILDRFPGPCDATSETRWQSRN